MGRLIGETFDASVKIQIQQRQQTAGSGLDGKRTAEQLQVQNNQNSWLKLASSVRFITDAQIVEELSKVDKELTLEKFKESERKNGITRLKEIGLTNPDQFMGKELARKSVLFNSMSEVILSTNSSDGEDRQAGTNGNYLFRSGITKSNSLWDSSSAYGLGGPSQGIVPPPGLIDATVESLNRGSIRKATVNIKAHNKFQFELIELLYIRLGYTMLLEWGNDKFINNNGDLQLMGNTLTEDIWFKDKEDYTFRDLIQDVSNYRDLYSGNYDGFIGKVSNFSWDFDVDGTYNISLNLISVGDVIESITVNNPATLKTEKEIEEVLSGYQTVVDNSDSILKSAIVTNAGTSTLAYDLFTDIIDVSDAGKSKWEGGENSNYLNFYKLINDGDSGTGIMNDIAALNDGEGVDVDKYSYFLTLGELLKKVKNFCLSTTSNVPVLDIDLDVEEVIMSTFPNQISLNPKIALVKPKFIDSISLNNNKEFEANLTGIKADWGWAKNMQDWMVVDTGNKDVTYGQTLNVYLNYDFVTRSLEKQTKKGEIFLFKFLQDICDGINEALGGTPNLEPVIQDDFRVVIQDQNKPRGIENSKFKDRYSTEADFELFGYNVNGSKLETKVIPTSNIVRSFGFKTKITPALSSMISIGATSNGTSTKNYDATAFSNWNAGLRDQYQLNHKDAKLVDKEKTLEGNNKYAPLTFIQVSELYDYYKEKGEIDEYWGIFPRWSKRGRTYRKFGKSAVGVRDVEDSPITGRDYGNVGWSEYINAVIRDIDRYKVDTKPEELEKFSDSYIRYLIQGFRGKILGQVELDGYYFHLNNDFIKQGIQNFKAYVNLINNAIYAATGSPSTRIGFIPVSLELTCDGIGGIKIYQNLNIRQEFLPKQYPNALEFVITKVNHTISNNDWSTSLSTISTPKTKEQNIPSFLENVVKSVTADTVSEYKVYEGDKPKFSLTTRIPLENNGAKDGLIYYPQATAKTQIVLHHTAGRSTAKQEILNNWAKQPYSIATHYIIERENQTEHVFPDDFWSNHIGSTDSRNTSLNKKSLSIEIEAIGYLKLRDNKWFDYTGKEIPLSEAKEPYMVDSNGNIVPMAGGYKGFARYQSYTPSQLSSLKTILLGWKNKYNIPIYLNKDNFKDLFPNKYSTSNNAMGGIGGIYTHNSYRTDKTDMFPQKELLELLQEIGNS